MWTLFLGNRKQKKKKNAEIGGTIFRKMNLLAM